MIRTAILCISLLVTLGIHPGAEAQERHARTSFTFREIPLSVALDSLMRWFPVSIVYLDRDVDGKAATASCVECTFETALNNVLVGTSLAWMNIGNQVVLKERSVPSVRVTGTVAGLVTDSVTGESLAGANVLLNEHTSTDRRDPFRWCPANTGGFYSLRSIPPGTYTITVQAIGYQSAFLSVSVPDDRPVRLDFTLAPREIILPEVAVEGKRSALSTAEGFARGTYIRTAPSDPHQYYLDGVRIYNPSHFGGVLSTFNPDALNDVDIVVGGLPPSYGGRIGGVLDYALRNGNRAHLSGTASIGSLGTDLSLEGPLADNTTFLLSGRRGYPDPAVPFLENHGTPSPLGSSELVARISRRLSASDRLAFSAYYGEDSYNNYTQSDSVQLSNNFSWGNSALNVQWTAVVSSSVFLQASGFYTRYNATLQHLMSGQPWPPSPLSSGYTIEDAGIRAHAEHFYDDMHTVRGGVELVRHRMAGTISSFSTQIGRLSLEGLSSWELSVYLQDSWRILPGVSAELGARATTFSGNRGTLSGIDPRFSLLVDLNEQTRVYGALTSINQYLHPYRNSGVFLVSPAMFWYPSGESVKPSTAVQFTLGIQRDLENHMYEVSAESYYRVTNALHEFAISLETDLLEEAIHFGTGTAYGAQFLLRRRTGDLTGSIVYTLSWEDQQFDDLNGGAPFPPRFERRHELKVESWYAPDSRWAFGVLCLIASDLSPSPAPHPAGPARDAAIVLPAATGDVDLNGSRLPGFQRLELNVLRRFVAGGYDWQLAFRLVNGYGLLDPFTWQVRQSADVRTSWSAIVEKIALFPLYPTVGLSVRF